MAANLVSSVMQFVTPDLVARIASALGLDRGTAQKAIGAGIPALLAGLAGVASKPDGARQLSTTLSQQQPGALDGILNAIGGSGQTAVVDKGSSMLSSLFGGGQMNALTSAVSNSTGINPSTGKSLLGMLGPVVMGALGQQQRSTGSDAASLLASQKDQIAAAMPSGLVDQLSGSGLMDTFDEMRDGAAAVASRFGSASRDTAAGASQAVHAVGQHSAPASQWPYWLAGLLALAGLGWYFLGNQGTPIEARSVPTTTERVAPVATSPSLSGVNLADQLTSSVGTIRTALEGITDATSAQAAVPRLQESATILDRIGSAATQLPSAQQSTIASMIGTAMPGLNQLFDKVLAIPGAADVVKPAIDTVRTELEGLSRV